VLHSLMLSGPLISVTWPAHLRYWPRPFRLLGRSFRFFRPLLSVTGCSSPPLTSRNRPNREKSKQQFMKLHCVVSLSLPQWRFFLASVSK
jgi:hypothetical protein